MLNRNFFKIQDQYVIYPFKKEIKKNFIFIYLIFFLLTLFTAPL